MKRLILSGALLLCAATNCTGARAAWVGSNLRTEKSRDLPGAGVDTSGQDDASWSTTNDATRYASTSNYVSFRATVRNGRHDILPVWDSQLSTGGSLIKDFTWDQPTTPPTYGAVYHYATFSGHLGVNIPAGSDNGTRPAATAKVQFSVFPANWPGTDPERGAYVSVARPNGKPDDPDRMAATYVYYNADGTYRTGSPTRYPGGSVSGNRPATNLTRTTTQSVEVQIKGFTEANGQEIPPLTFLTAQADGSVSSDPGSFIMR